MGPCSGQRATGRPRSAELPPPPEPALPVFQDFTSFWTDRRRTLAPVPSVSFLALALALSGGARSSDGDGASGVVERDVQRFLMGSKGCASASCSIAACDPGFLDCALRGGNGFWIGRETLQTSRLARTPRLLATSSAVRVATTRSQTRNLPMLSVALQACGRPEEQLFSKLLEGRVRCLGVGRSPFGGRPAGRSQSARAAGRPL